MAGIRCFVPMAVLLLLAACGPKTRWDHTPRDQHIVRTGETLFTIGWRYGEDARDLARWNKLGDGSLIYPGQVIRLTPPPGERRASSELASKQLNRARCHRFRHSRHRRGAGRLPARLQSNSVTVQVPERAS